jgi:hypothetical protein
MSSREEHIKWLENENNVRHYEYSKFEDVQPIGSGAFGNVFSGKFENTTYALKSLNNNNNEQTLKNIVKEVSYY